MPSLYPLLLPDIIFTFSVYLWVLSQRTKTSCQHPEFFPERKKTVTVKELFVISRGFCLLLCLYDFLLGCLIFFFFFVSVCWSLVLPAKVWKLCITSFNLCNLLGFCSLHLRVPELYRISYSWIFSYSNFVLAQVRVLQLTTEIYWSFSMPCSTF